MGIYKSEGGRQAVEAMYKGVLHRWPVPHREVVVPTCQGDTFVVVSGDAGLMPIVLFHGSGANSAVWFRDVIEWAKQYCVYAVDLIGEPGLSAPSRPPLASDAYAMWLDDVWKGLGLERASIVGVSLGAWLALDYAVRRPQHVTALSLLSPAGIGRQNLTVLLKAAVLLTMGRWGLRKSSKIAAGPSGNSDAATRFMTTIFQHFRPRMERIPIRTDAELAALAMPVQVILGGKDALLRSQETRARLERLVPRLLLTYLENEGHILPKQTGPIAQFLSAAAVEEDPARIALKDIGQPDLERPNMQRNTELAPTIRAPRGSSSKTRNVVT